MRITAINGAVCHVRPASGLKLREMVLVGRKRLIAEVIAIAGDEGTVQVYEETTGLSLGEPCEGTGRPLRLALAPGLLGHIFDGIERPLDQIRDENGAFIPEGLGLKQLSTDKVWPLTFTVKVGDVLNPGDVYAEVDETTGMKHRLLLPPDIGGTVTELIRTEATITQPVIKIRDASGDIREIPMVQYWPVRTPRPVAAYLTPAEPLITGQRVLDIFFPLAKGGRAAIPGGFGTGKTMTQHQIAKWCDADVIVYIGCGERGNEMTNVLDEFSNLEDPRTGRKLLERTILIANTSNMPVAAREASIYTGVTMAEYYRDMGYDVAIMADSTSRWAEALREISGRLEELPGEEGYPAYLASRLAAFYERAGRVKTLGGAEASVSIIGAVSPAGGDFSEPVTESTKRFVNAFYSLDRKLAYARHFPAIQWMTSYSDYATMLEPWYRDRLGRDAVALRNKMLQVLHDEEALQEIVQLIGEEALPDEQRLTLQTARLIKIGFLQQNAFIAVDSYVPLEKQYRMLKAMERFYDEARQALATKVPYSKVINNDLIARLERMKLTVPNDHPEQIDELVEAIETYYDGVRDTYAMAFKEA